MTKRKRRRAPFDQYSIPPIPDLGKWQSTTDRERQIRDFRAVLSQAFDFMWLQVGLESTRAIFKDAMKQGQRKRPDHALNLWLVRQYDEYVAQERQRHPQKRPSIKAFVQGIAGNSASEEEIHAIEKRLRGLRKQPRPRGMLSEILADLTSRTPSRS